MNGRQLVVMWSGLLLFMVALLLPVEFFSEHSKDMSGQPVVFDKEGRELQEKILASIVVLTVGGILTFRKPVSPKKRL